MVVRVGTRASPLLTRSSWHLHLDPGATGGIRRAPVASAREAGTWPLATRSTFSRLCGILETGRDQFPARPQELTLRERVHGEPRLPASERLGHLGGWSNRTGKRQSVSVLVREAIDERLPGDADERRASLQAVLDARPMDVPGPEELHEELEAIRSRRG